MRGSVTSSLSSFLAAWPVCGWRGPQPQVRGPPQELLPGCMGQAAGHHHDVGCGAAHLPHRVVERRAADDVNRVPLDHVFTRHDLQQRGLACAVGSNQQAPRPLGQL